MVATLILSLQFRIAEAGHLAAFHQNLSGGKAVPYNIFHGASSTGKLRADHRASSSSHTPSLKDAKFKLLEKKLKVEIASFRQSEELIIKLIFTAHGPDPRFICNAMLYSRMAIFIVSTIVLKNIP